MAGQSRLGDALPIANRYQNIMHQRKALIILNEFNNDDLNWLLQNSQPQRLQPSEVLIYEGQSIPGLYFILDGSLSILLDNSELARIGQGEIVGEISFLDERPPIATVKALEPSLLLATPRLRLLPKLNRDGGFAARFYRGLSLCLADRMRGTIQRLGYGLELRDLYREDALDPLKAEQLALAQMKFDWLVNATQPR